jgi:hypothetical protein
MENNVNGIENKYIKDFLGDMAAKQSVTRPVSAPNIDSQLPGNNGHEPQTEPPEWDEPDLTQEAPNDVDQSVNDMFLPERTQGSATPMAYRAEKPRYSVFTAADALKPQPPTEYLVDKVIPTCSVVMFYGDPGAGKTYAAISMGAHVAGGLEWLGYAVKKGTVLIIDEENGERRLKKRLGAALRGEGLGPDTPIFCISLANFKMDDYADCVILQGEIERTGAQLVIIDALADVMDGDENSKEDTQPVFSHLKKIAEVTGATIVVIHHSNKAGGYRGSSAIKGAVDLLIQIANVSNVITFTAEKTRDGEDQTWSAIATWLAWDTPQETFTLRAHEIEKVQHYNKAQKYVLRFLEEVGTPTSMEDIENSADACTANAAQHAVYSLVGQGVVYRTNPGGRGTQAMFALVKKADDAIQF